MVVENRYYRSVFLRSRRVITPSGVRPALIQVLEGRIAAVGGYGDGGPRVIDYGDLVIMPGLVDSHVHVNEPGRTEWEGFETATRAAAAGGVTTIVDMPLNSIPPTTSVAALQLKREALMGKAWVDVALWGGAVPGNAAELELLLDAGAVGFKCFMVDSGVPEFPPLSITEIAEVAGVLSEARAPLIVHAESPEHLGPAGPTYPEYLRSRPASGEDAAIERLRDISERTRTRIHVVHLSSAGALDTLRRAREATVSLTAETTPHYLFFTAEQIPEAATEYKCAPPIRERENRERLWEGLRQGLIDMVVTDHSPAPPEMKRGDFARAWGGIASVQFGLAATWTEARARGFGPKDMARWMCEAPARLSGLASRKGSIAPGQDADLVVWDPDEAFVVEPSRIEHRHKLTPYLGAKLFGQVRATWVGGRKIYDNGSHIGSPSGRWIH